MSSDIKFRYLFPPVLDEPILSRDRGAPLKVQLTWRPEKETAKVDEYVIYRKTWDQNLPAEIGRVPGNIHNYIDVSPVEGAVNTYSIQSTSKVGKCSLSSPMSRSVSVYGFDAIFHDYESLRQTMIDMAEKNPQRVTFRDVGVSRSGKHKMMALIVDDKNSQVKWKKTFWMSAQLHASETIGTDLIMALLKRLLVPRGSDSRIDSFLEECRLVCVPMTNPDGQLKYSRGYPGYGRKNLLKLPKFVTHPIKEWKFHDHYGGEGVEEGVDLNRNYDACWELLSEKLKIAEKESGGQNKASLSSNYCGLYAFSEPETKAIVSLAKEMRPIVAIDFHGPGGFYFIPGKRSGKPMVECETYNEIGLEMAKLTYGNFPAEDLKVVIGNGPSPFLSEWLFDKLGCWGFTCEGFYGLLPPMRNSVIICASRFLPEMSLQNLNILFYLQQRFEKSSLWIEVRDEKTLLPLEAEISVVEVADDSFGKRHTAPQNGRYIWPLQPGIYHLDISREGYKSKKRLEFTIFSNRKTVIKGGLKHE